MSDYILARVKPTYLPELRFARAKINIPRLRLHTGQGCTTYWPGLHLQTGIRASGGEVREREVREQGDWAGLGHFYPCDSLM